MILFKVAKQQNKYSPKSLKFGNTLKQKIHKQSYRDRMLDRYGKDAFLMPEQKKFPIVNPNTGKVSCKMLKAAKIRASQHNYQDIVAKADRLLRQNNCI